jgi:peptidoglycan/LPS O-acetylase OafA/YrhL
MNHRPEVDGLRALAVAAVIINHFSKALLPSGYLGVDIFFVISGYVITASLHERGTQGLSRLLLDFYVRRVKRLLPALVLFVLGASVMISLVNPSPSITLKAGMASLFGLSNFYLIRQALDYFGDSAQLNAFTHTWSLAVEEQFYIFFPFIVWATGFRRQTGGRTWPFYTVLGLLSLASLAAFVYLNATAPALAYYLMPTRFWELGAGSLAFWLTQRWPMAVSSTLTLKAAAGLLLGLVCATLLAPSEWQTSTTILATALAVGLIWLTRPGTLPYSLFTSPVFVYIGLISYSLYLWHWPVLVVSRWSVGIYWWTAPVQVLLMLLLAAASYHCVEKPLRAASWSIRQWPSIAYGFGSVVLAAALLLVLIKPLDGWLYAGQRPPLVAAGVESLALPYTLAGTTWTSQACVLSSNGDVGKIVTPEGCTLGDLKTARRRVLVIGNSHAAAFTHAFDRLVQEDQYAVTITSSWGASPIKEVPNVSFWQEANRYYWHTTVPALVAQLKEGDWVFLLSDLVPLTPPATTAGGSQMLTLLQDGLKRFSGELSQRGIRMAMLHGLPYAREANCDPAATMRQWFSPFGGPCKFLSKQTSMKRRADLDRALHQVASETNIAVIDLFDLFCPGDICHYQGLDGTYMYRDMWSHPSVEAARLSAPFIRQVLNPETAVAARGRDLKL